MVKDSCVYHKTKDESYHSPKATRQSKVMAETVVVEEDQVESTFGIPRNLSECLS